MWEVLPFITKALASNDKFLEISRRDELDEDLDPEVEVELRPILVGSRVPLSLWIRLNCMVLEAAADKLADPEAAACAKSRFGSLVLVSTASAKAV